MNMKKLLILFTVSIAFTASYVYSNDIFSDSGLRLDKYKYFHFKYRKSKDIYVLSPSEIQALLKASERLTLKSCFVKGLTKNPLMLFAYTDPKPDIKTDKPKAYTFYREEKYVFAGHLLQAVIKELQGKTPFCYQIDSNLSNFIQKIEQNLKNEN